MKKKEFKACIAYKWEIKENTGGPSGYLFNLKRGLKNINSNFHIFYSENKIIKSDKSKKSIRKKYKYPFIEDIKISLYYLRKNKWITRDEYNTESFDIIHFQAVEELYECLYYKNNKKFILTPHRPEPLYIEKINEIKTEMKTKYKFYILAQVLKYIEKKAYRECDGFIFPSKEAMQIYMRFPGFGKEIIKKPVEWLITGCDRKIGVKKFIEKDNIRIISFIGRHNEIKGYNFLKSVFINNKSYFEDNNIKIICAGKISGEFPISNNWEELGVIKDPENLIASSDIVILPNQNTYFDLVALEVLSQGKVLLASNTGGNLSLNKQTKGVVIFEKNNEEDFLRKIDHILSLSDKEIQYLEELNSIFFDRYCSLDKFASNYLLAIDKLEKQLFNHN